MTTQHYAIHINAPREKVWHTMLDQDTYQEWTRVFSEGSRYEGSWEEGAKIVFIGFDPGTGEEGGMVSRIKESRPYEFVSIEHLGLVSGGVEDTTSEEAKKFAGALENYTFTEKDGGTELSIALDMDDEYIPMFNEMWPKSLEKLKEIAERN